MQLNDEIIKIKDAIVSAVDVEKLYLFGSYAYGTPSEDSDYDFYMVIPDGGMRPIEAIGEAHYAMFGNDFNSSDILAGTTESFERRSRQSTLERKIATEGVLLYER